MKVKIRGLVFVGFAAAVFAQSAMADPDPAKTVTSKLYVDSKVEGVTETGSGDNITYGDTTIDEDSPNDKAPSALNVYKFVTDTVGDAAITIQGDSTYLTASEDDGTWTVSPKETVATTAAELTGPIANGVAGAFTGTAGNKLVSATAVKALIDGEIANGTTTLSDATTGGSTNATVPTSKNVVDYAEKKANKATAIVTSGTGQNNTSQTGGDTAYPTTKAVYDFVTTQGANYQRKLTDSENALYIGKWDGTLNNGAGDSTWKALEAVSSNDQASTDYVTIKADTNGVYQVNIPAAQIATTAALTGATATNDTGLVTAGSVRETILQAGSTAGGTIASAATAQNNNTSDETVPTTKNVYEFVTTYGGNTYQPKIADGNANTIMIGYNTQTGTGGEATYSSNWKALQGTQYISVGMDNELSVAKIALDNNYIADTGGAITSADGTSTNNAYNSDLTTAAAVHEYVAGLLNGNVLPAPGSDCQLGANGITDSNDKACALVLAYWSAADSPTGTAGVGLKWVPMAQTVSNP